MGFCEQGWTNQWHLEDSVTLECRRYSINMLVQAMKPSSEHDDNLFEYAKSVEKTMFNIASRKKSYFHLMAESIFNHYCISKASNLETNETPSFGLVIDQKILQHFKDSDKDSVKTIPNEYIKSWHDGNVSSKLRIHMVHLNCIPPPYIQSYTSQVLYTIEKMCSPKSFGQTNNVLVSGRMHVHQAKLKFDKI